MESLAVAAVVVMLSIVFVDLAAIATALLGFRSLAFLFGTAAAMAGFWIFLMLPHLAIFAIFNIGCGAFAIARSVGKV